MLLCSYHAFHSPSNASSCVHLSSMVDKGCIPMQSVPTSSGRWGLTPLTWSLQDRFQHIVPALDRAGNLTVGLTLVAIGVLGVREAIQHQKHHAQVSQPVTTEGVLIQGVSPAPRIASQLFQLFSALCCRCIRIPYAVATSRDNACEQQGNTRIHKQSMDNTHMQWPSEPPIWQRPAVCLCYPGSYALICSMPCVLQMLFRNALKGVDGDIASAFLPLVLCMAAILMRCLSSSQH